MEDIDPELRPPGLEEVVGYRATAVPAAWGDAAHQPAVARVDREDLGQLLLQHPHACLAMAKSSTTSATWGTSSAMGESTADPGDDSPGEGDEQDYEFSDDDDAIVSAPQMCPSEASQEDPPPEVPEVVPNVVPEVVPEVAPRLSC